MLVPRYWAEGRVHRPRRGRDGRQITVRRWGWSDASQEAAQSHADQRAREAFDRIASGEKAPRREPKVPYNGAEGVPIREEIVARHGETVVTRNSYGALCLNTPRVLFADIDFPESVGFVAGFLGSVALGLLVAAGLNLIGMGRYAIVAGVIALASGPWIVNRLYLSWCESRGGMQQVARERVVRFLSRNPHWSLSLYRTPAGLRVMALHQLFDPNGDECQALFRSLRCDPIYAAMCRRQACFRARVSPKPWRVGLKERLRPRPGVWPINPERLPDRLAWIANYERASEGFAACRYLDTLGSAMTHPDALEVQRLHDKLSNARSDRPIA
ncbi:hypothetical protein MalM25_09010 [Planctomycetes bacterium MalM25]|nr:hypothetical protein MalM25_09010 [Planctomycetes bacterium MalM25]